jgi:hypothetical protein
MREGESADIPIGHQEFQKAMVQGGEDIGRVKDQELAHEIADKVVKRGIQHDNVAQDNLTRHEVTKKVVNAETDRLAARITHGAVSPDDPVFHSSPERDAYDVAGIRKTAAETVSNYDLLQNVAMDEKAARENAPEKSLRKPDLPQSNFAAIFQG